MKRPVRLGKATLGKATGRTQVLALSGGGYRGLFTARLLQELEDRATRPLGQCFDVVAGTSIGGISALALAAGCRAADVRSAIEEQGPRLFGGRWRGSTAIHRLVRAPYSSAMLRRLIEEVLEESAQQNLRELDCPVVVPAVSQTRGRPCLLRSRGLAGEEADDLSLTDAALATAAAPTFFPPHRAGHDNLVDGGLIANAPDLVAVTETVRRFSCDLRSLHVLSIGTASPAPEDFVRDAGKPGLVGWARHLVQLTMQSQERLVVEQCRALLRPGHYHRLDRKPSGDQAKVLGLDRADRRATETLLLLAEETIQEKIDGGQDIDAFLAHQTHRESRNTFL